MKEFIKSVMTVNKDVREAAINTIIHRCQLKYMVAFSQWRYKRDNADKELVKSNLDSISKHFFAHVDIVRKPKHMTWEKAFISPDLEQRYKLNYDDQDGEQEMKSSPYLIHSFWCLGLPDPFPDASTMMDTCNCYNDPNSKFTVEHLVYPQSRYNDEYSPMIIYLPSKPMMVKIMRACIGC